MICQKYTVWGLRPCIQCPVIFGFLAVPEPTISVLNGFLKHSLVSQWFNWFLLTQYVGIFSFFYQSNTREHIWIFHHSSLHALLQYTVVPTRRSTAEAMMIFIGHLLGDAGSPYFVGLVRNSNFRLIRSNQLTLHVYLFLCHITVNQSVIFVVNWQTVSFKLLGIVYCPFLRCNKRL